MLTANNAAIKAILEVDSGKKAQEAAEAAYADVDLRERAQCADLVYGVLRSRLRIQYILSQVLKNLQKLPHPMRVALELAVYSLFFQDSKPAYAVLNETVKIIKKQFGRQLAGVANGALRSILRLGNLPNEQAWYFGAGKNRAGLEATALYYSLPLEICQIWQSAYGQSAMQNLMERSFNRPYSAFRVNMARPEGKKILAELQNWPGAQPIGKLGAAFPPGKLPDKFLNEEFATLIAQGALSRQAAGSMRIMTELGILESWQNKPVWDMCAGAGGKTAIMLENGLNVSLATDISRQRLKRLAFECKRLGLETPAMALADGAMAPIAAWQGNILIDAPCSGLGVLARRPDLKIRWNGANTQKLIAIQSELLNKAARLLESKSQLCYLTCTLNPDENEGQVERLLNKNPGFKLINQWQTPNDDPWLEGMFGAVIAKD